jgi:hypothetical protein
MGRIGMVVAVLLVTCAAAAEAQRGSVGVSLTVVAPPQPPPPPTLQAASDGSFSVVVPAGMEGSDSSTEVWVSTDAVHLSSNATTADLLQRVLPAAQRCPASPLAASSCGEAIPLAAPAAKGDSSSSATVLYMIIPNA